LHWSYLDPTFLKCMEDLGSFGSLLISTFHF
jgi:hypothetical protein